MIVDLDQEYQIQYKEGWSRQSGSASFGTKVVPWCHLWMELIWVLWTQLLDPTC